MASFPFVALSKKTNLLQLEPVTNSINCVDQKFFSGRVGGWLSRLRSGDGEVVGFVDGAGGSILDLGFRISEVGGVASR